MEKKFAEIGIDIDDLDSEMIPLLHTLNFTLNLKTKYSCIGHHPNDPISVMFDESVEFLKLEQLSILLAENNERIKGVANIKNNKFMYVSCSYWIRKPLGRQLLKNWTIKTDYENLIELERVSVVSEIRKILLENADMFK
ncbi:hypothetical protein EBB07_28795 [Paenibacillaceae bacterium]|nr:hypothetical protein EBB07_28795 [Paenibacillaceae bacterium]